MVDINNENTIEENKEIVNANIGTLEKEEILYPIVDEFQYSWLCNCGEYVGMSHLPHNIPCQDKTITIQKNKTTVAVLSDGCGSSHFAHFGSEITTQSVGDLLSSRFDELFELSQISFCKTVIDTVIDALKKYIHENSEMFDKYIKENQKKYSEFSQKVAFEDKREIFCLDSLNATMLFVAEKDGKIIMGQIGDGYIGAVKENKLIIAMEEDKKGSKNGTIYPSTIYKALQKYGEDVYKYLKVKKSTSGELFGGFILISDGPDGLVDSRTPFQRKFSRGVNTLFTMCVKESKEDAKNYLLSYLKEKLVPNSTTSDDCSVCLMVKKDYTIEEFVVTHYERPEIVTVSKESEKHDADDKASSKQELSELEAQESVECTAMEIEVVNEIKSGANVGELLENAKNAGNGYPEKLRAITRATNKGIIKNQ